MNNNIVVVSGMGDDGYDFRSRLQVRFDESNLDFLEGDAEDATLGRDYSGCYGIAQMMVLANRAGLEGRELNIENIEDNDIFSENYK